MKLLLRASFLIFSLFLFTFCSEPRQQPVFEFSQTNPADTGSRFPFLYSDREGLVSMSWLLHIEEEIYALQFSTFRDGRWTVPQTTRIATDYFVNWADFPSVVSYQGEVIALHSLRRLEGGPYAYNVNITFRDEETGRWDRIITPHLDGTATEHGFVSMQPLDSEHLLAVWLDGRNTEGRSHIEYEDHSMAMTLRSAVISRDGTVSAKRAIDQVVCDCCQTDLVEVNGEFLVVYRGRSTDEVRDIMISRYNPQTEEWTDPVAVAHDGWGIQACPVNGPRIAAHGNQVAVVWFTEADDHRRVLLAHSSDSGHIFNSPQLIAENSTAGRADLLFTDGGELFVSWLDARDEAGHVMLRQIGQDGSSKPPITAGITTSSRSSGFPRIAYAGDSILVAWTQTDPLIRVRTALVPLP